MIRLTLQKNCTLLKNALAAVANIMSIKASIFYDKRGLSLYVFEMRSGLLIAILDLLPTGFECFDFVKTGYVDIDLTTFCEYVNLARDNEVVTISFGDIRKIKTVRGDKTIKFQFKDVGQLCNHCCKGARFHPFVSVWDESCAGSNLITGGRNMEFSKGSVSVSTFKWQKYDLAFGIPSQKFKRVFSELAIPREAAIGPDEDSLHIYMSNGQLRFSAHGRVFILLKELGHYEIRGAEIMQAIEEACSRICKFILESCEHD